MWASCWSSCGNRTCKNRNSGYGSQPGRVYKLLGEGGDELPTVERAVVDSWLLSRARQGVTWAP